MLVHDFNDGNGPVPAHQHPNGGGWIAETAYVSESAYVGPDAKVYGKAAVFGDSKICGKARVFGNVVIWDTIEIGGENMIYSHSDFEPVDFSVLKYNAELSRKIRFE